MAFDFEYIYRRYTEFWNMANEDRPLISITAAKKYPSCPPPEGPADLRDRWMDTEFQLKSFRWGMENTHYLGESYPLFNPNLGPDILGAVCGCDLHFGDVTSWASHCIEDYKAHPPIVFDENNFCGKKSAKLPKLPLKMPMEITSWASRTSIPVAMQSYLCGARKTQLWTSTMNRNSSSAAPGKPTKYSRK